MPTVNVTRVASALNLSEQRVQQLVKEGMPREGRGEYDPIKCMMWYIRYLSAAIEKKGIQTLDGSDAGERYERVRLLRATADLRERELAGIRSQMISAADADKAVADLVTVTTVHGMKIPASIAPQLVGETSRVMIQAKIEKAIKAMLSSLARVMNDGSTPRTLVNTSKS